MWPHSSSWQDKYSLASDGELLAVPGVVPSLVLELARWQLNSLLGVDFPVSKAVEEVERQPWPWERSHLDEDGERP